jgi:tripartite-type tricarboxylate transporter receptor subunit TctC
MKVIRTMMAFLVALATAAAAANYPSRPVRLILPFAAGGPSDAIARLVGQQLRGPLGQTVIIENRPGADGAIAGQGAAAATPDGHSLFFASTSQLALPHVMTPAPFDTFSDFAPVSSIGRFAFCILVHPGVPAQSLKQFVAHARSNPGKLSYVSNNLTEHLAASLFMKASGTEMLRVPYKGVPQAVPDLATGRVQVAFWPVTAALPHVREGRLRMLATLLPQRTPATADIPTIAEAGFPGISIQSYQMILAPARVPKPAVDRLVRDVNSVLDNADLRAQLEKQAFVVEGSTPQRLAAIMRESDRTWAQFARDNRLGE